MKKYNFRPQKFKKDLLTILSEIKTTRNFNKRKLVSILKKYPKDGNALFAKDELVQGYYFLVQEKVLPEDKNILNKIKMKPTRSISGVLPLTVLTRPFPCPGKCIFCPNDIRMPKSYLSDEPGAQRAERNHFDPYLQTYNRLLAFRNTGHETGKVELIILGGTWSYYPEAYQLWFIKRCFEALNDFGVEDKREEVATANIYTTPEKSKAEFSHTGRRKTYNEQVLALEKQHAKQAGLEFSSKQDYSAQRNHESASWKELEAEHRHNESATARCVGLVIETRPDHIDEKEVIRLRRLGATKTQIGFQSLQDEVLDKNHRGHDVVATERAVSLVRSGGFKIHVHWMPNLYGSTPEKDKQDYLRLFTEPFVPDEVKIYPCSLIETAELMDYYKQGLWRPYTESELLDVLSFCLTNTPRHVRLTRIIRDIPSQDIVVGNKKTNFRQIVENHIQKENLVLQDIRAREIKDQEITLDDIELKEYSYMAQNSYGSCKEIFLEYITKGSDTIKPDRICGFLRLSLPIKTNDHFISELAASAIIREVHVYGVAQNVGEHDLEGSSQHLGLGQRLIARAKGIAKDAGYQNLAVISAIGTKEYYRKCGFKDGQLYQHCPL